MKTLGCVLAVLLVLAIAMPAAAALRNAGDQVPMVPGQNILTPVGARTPVRVLYAPSEADDPAYRAMVAAALPAGSVVDYFDANTSTPSATLLATYDAVHTWANYAYNNNVLFGDNLADFVDAGGRVVLGAFVTYCYGNFLSGRIMTPAYCGANSPSCSNHVSTAYWAGDAADMCDYNDVTSWGAQDRDYLAVQGSGVVWGHFTDNELADVVGPGEGVHLVNGSGGAPIMSDAAIAVVVANACWCSNDPVPVEESTWGMVKKHYR